jgi:OmpA-OmpF porin, OOP family
MSEKRLPGGTGKAAYSFAALFLLALTAAALLPARALAQQGTGGESGAGIALPSGGWYSGLSAERSRIGIRDSLLPVTGARLSNLAQDESSTGYKFFGGYRFNSNFALEGGYADFSKLGARREFASQLPGFGSNDIGASGFYFGAVGVVPLPNRFSLFGKLGTGYTTSTGSMSISGAALPLLTPVDMSMRRSEWSSKYGLGASYEMSNKLGLRFEYERINSAGDGRIEGNAGMWSLGLIRRY